MISQILIQLRHKKREYLLVSVITFFSFFVFALLFNFVSDYLISAFTPRIPVSIENCVEFRVNWKSGERWKTPNHLRAEFRERVLRLDDVVAADYVVNEMVEKLSYCSWDIRTENTFTFYSGEQIGDVFDLELAQGRWFTDVDANIEQPQVVITQNHADFLGIKHLTSKTTFRVKMSKKDSISFKVVGILKDVDNMNVNVVFDKSTFPLFTSVESMSHKIRRFSSNESLVLRMRPGFLFSDLNADMLNVFKQLKMDDVMVSPQLITMERRVWNCVKDHLHEARVIYLCIIIVFCYLFVTLLGSFLKIARKRTVEIGIRRAIGHSRLRVMWYVISETLVVYTLSVFSATILSKISFLAGVFNFSLYVYLFSCGLILLVVLIAAIVPAFRSSRIQPVKALSSE